MIDDGQGMGHLLLDRIVSSKGYTGGQVRRKGLLDGALCLTGTAYTPSTVIVALVTKYLR
jgi:hypothetical protein